MAQKDPVTIDPRLYPVQADRAAKMIRTTVLSSPLWAGVLAWIASEQTPYFGSVPSHRALALVLMVLGTAAATQVLLARYAAERRAGFEPSVAKRWLTTFLAVAGLFSGVWGWSVWLLWDPYDPVNHVFVTFACLAIIARVVVHRANHLNFFLGSFLPLTALLMARLVFEFQPMEMILAGIVPLYAIQVVMDSSNISQRWDNEAASRLAMEDMSHALEHARDEALAKRAEAELANASKTAFLANMSHELRTPLNAILGFSDIISHEYLGPVGRPRYREYAADIHSSGAHLLSLINDLLDVAKIESGRMEIAPELICARPTVDDALKFIGARARDRKQVLSIAVDEAAEFVYADERALKQVVINLVSNAVKFTPEGGRIDVRIRRNESGDVELAVADSGPGIPKARLERIFKPYFQLDNRFSGTGEGTGLGLALVKGLAELHGGRAWIESEEAKGTRVFVVFPGRALPQEARLSA